MPESRAGRVVSEIVRVAPMETAADIASGEHEPFDAVAEDVLGSYLDSDDGPDDGELDDGYGSLRLLLSRTLVALYHEELDVREARRRLMETGASPESVDEFLEGSLENLDEIDLHLRRVRVEELSEEIRELRWDALGR